MDKTAIRLLWIIANLLVIIARRLKRTDYPFLEEDKLDKMEEKLNNVFRRDEY
jgi:hypothetical protein